MIWLKKDLSLHEELSEVDCYLQYYTERTGRSPAERDMLNRLLLELANRHMQLMNERGSLSRVLVEVNGWHRIPIVLYEG
jgi:hypothetical protein